MFAVRLQLLDSKTDYTSAESMVNFQKNDGTCGSLQRRYLRIAAPGAVASLGQAAGSSVTSVKDRRT